MSAVEFVFSGEVFQEGEGFFGRGILGLEFFDAKVEIIRNDFLELMFGLLHVAGRDLACDVVHKIFGLFVGPEHLGNPLFEVVLQASVHRQTT